MINVRRITQIALLALFVIVATACAAPTPTVVPPTAVPPTKPPATAVPPAPTVAPTAVPPTAVPPTATKPPATAANRFDAMSLTELVAAAKAEGSVVVYAFTSRIATVEKEFEKAYPGIDVVPTDLASTEMIARIKAEQQANIFKADVAYISDPPVVFGELVQKGMLERYMPVGFSNRVPAEFQQPLVANRLSTKVLMYNEQAYPNGSPVTNLWDLTTPKWKGKVVTVDPLVRGDYLDLMTEIVLRSDEMAKAYEAQFGKPIQLSSGVKSAGEHWIRDLYANDLILVKSTGDANKAIGKTGQTAPPVGFTTYSDRRDNQKEGWALQIANNVTPMSGILFTANLGLIKNAPHPAAARLLIHYMMGDDTPTGGAAYAPFYVPGDYATRTDITPHPDAIALDKLRAWRIDPAKSLTIRQQVSDYILKLK